jgi:predicted GNAT family N-acyltransferase
MMKKEIIEYGTPEYDETVRLRYEVLRKPLGLEFTEEQLAKEYQDTHLGIYNEYNELIACLIMTEKDASVVKMRQVAVSSELQGKGVGKELVYFFEAMAKHRGYKTIELHARETAVPFYEKLGYTAQGEIFTEVNIPHLYMSKLLVDKL